METWSFCLTCVTSDKHSMLHCVLACHRQCQLALLWWLGCKCDVRVLLHMKGDGNMTPFSPLYTYEAYCLTLTGQWLIQPDALTSWFSMWPGCIRNSNSIALHQAEKHHATVWAHSTTAYSTNVIEVRCCHTLDWVCGNLQWLNDSLVRQHIRSCHSTRPQVFNSDSPTQLQKLAAFSVTWSYATVVKLQI